MTAEVIQMESEIEDAIKQGTLTHIKITDAQMRLTDGVFTLRARDLLPPKVMTTEEAKQAKTSKERQAKFVKGKREAGFRKDWLHSSIEKLAKEVGGQDRISDKIDELQHRAKDAEQRADIAEAKLMRIPRFIRMFF